MVGAHGGRLLGGAGAVAVVLEAGSAVGDDSEGADLPVGFLGGDPESVGEGGDLGGGLGEGGTGVVGGEVGWDGGEDGAVEGCGEGGGVGAELGGEDGAAFGWA